MDLTENKMLQEYLNKFISNVPMWMHKDSITCIINLENGSVSLFFEVQRGYEYEIVKKNI